jgi:hypothetical protein
MRTPAGTTDMRVLRKMVTPAAILCPLKKKGPKGRRGQDFWAHTYPTVSSRPRGSRVQSLVQIGSEMWICIRYKQTFIFIYKIIHLFKSTTCFEHYPAHLQEVCGIIVYMQPLVSSLSAGDCPVHRLRKNFFLNRCKRQSPAESDDTRDCIYTITT